MEGKGTMVPAKGPEMTLSPVGSHALQVAEIQARKKSIDQLFDTVFKDTVHYGLIPGIEKPSLFQPGAQLINQMFCFRPQFDGRDVWEPGGHYTRIVKCVLVHYPTGLEIGEGDGICTTKEKKYRYRMADLKCPACEKTTIIKGKQEYGGGWICFAKKGGCGAKWPDGAKEIEGQPRGQIENPDLADCYNTVCKMADKRALVAACLNATGASDMFTQDVEDFPDLARAQAAAVEAQKKAEEAKSAHAATPPTPAPAPSPAPAAPPPSDTKAEDGSKTFITQQQMDELRNIAAKHKIEPAKIGILIHHTTGQKPESLSKVTKVQYKAIMSLFGKYEGGELRLNVEALKFEEFDPPTPEDGAEDSQ